MASTTALAAQLLERLQAEEAGHRSSDQAALDTECAIWRVAAAQSSASVAALLASRPRDELHLPDRAELCSVQSALRLYLQLRDAGSDLVIPLREHVCICAYVQVGHRNRENFVRIIDDAHGPRTIPTPSNAEAKVFYQKMKACIK